MRFSEQRGSIESFQRQVELEKEVAAWIEKHRPNANFVQRRALLNAVSWLVLSSSFMPCTLRDGMIFRIRPFRWPRTLKGYWKTFVTMEWRFGEWTIKAAIKHCDPICFAPTKEWLPRLAEAYIALQAQGFRVNESDSGYIQDCDFFVDQDDHTQVKEYIKQYNITYQPNFAEILDNFLSKLLG